MANVYRKKLLKEDGKTTTLIYDNKTPAKVIIKGVLEVLSGAYLGVAVTAETGAKVIINEGAVLNAKIQEDAGTTKITFILPLTLPRQAISTANIRHRLKSAKPTPTPKAAG